MMIRRSGKINPFGRLIKYQSAAEAGLTLRNYWGNGSDGDLNSTGNVTIPSTQDGDMVVKHYRNLTINSGHILTVQNRCRGLLLFVDGDLTVNGKISMTARGCKCNPADSSSSSNTPVAPGDGHGVGANGIRFPFLSPTGGASLEAAEFEGCGSALFSLKDLFPKLNGDGEILTIHRTGAGGGTGLIANNDTINGENGDPGSTGHTGGGGAGAAQDNDNGKSGDGGSGTCFSGGAGGGGAVYPGTSAAGNGSSFGGAGGYGVSGWSTSGGGGGAGNPGGAKANTAYNGSAGTGGLLIIICRGNILIGSSGSIESEGSAGGNAYGSYSNSAGAGSGGGRDKGRFHSGFLEGARGLRRGRFYSDTGGYGMKLWDNFPCIGINPLDIDNNRN